MQLFSSIVFAIMAVVLPVAGVQRYFCTMSMAFISDTNSCPVEKKDCCGNPKKQLPSEPYCMVVAKLIPNAEKSGPMQIPAAIRDGSIIPGSMAGLVPSERAKLIAPQNDRGSPDRNRLFIEHQRLLI
jgi:hypothetical protein